jgi:UDP-N-acetylglucosamine 2-epimerase (non-hydrolysing)
MDLPPDHQIRLLEPLGYLDFLCMMVKSRAVFTDSGGIQEETTALSIPCLTLRENTERPVTTEEGTNRLAGTTTAGILAAWEETRRNPKSGKLPRFWDGEAAGRCRGVLRDFFVDRIAREAQSEAVTRES